MSCCAFLSPSPLPSRLSLPHHPSLPRARTLPMLMNPRLASLSLALTDAPVARCCARSPFKLNSIWQIGTLLGAWRACLSVLTLLCMWLWGITRKLDGWGHMATENHRAVTLEVREAQSKRSSVPGVRVAVLYASLHAPMARFDHGMPRVLRVPAAGGLSLQPRSYAHLPVAE